MSKVILRTLSILIVVIVSIVFKSNLYAADAVKDDRYLSYIKEQAKDEAKYGQWTSCSVDSDCTAGIAGCYKWVAYNKKFNNEMIKEWENTICRSSNPEALNSNQPVTVCVEGKCRKTAKETSVTVAEWEKNKGAS